MKTIWTSDTLEGIDSEGKPKYWKIHVLVDGDKGYTSSETWGILASGEESKRGLSTPAYCPPKSQPTSAEQARFECASQRKKKIDKGYWVLGEKPADKLPLPMLAQKFNERSHNITYPCAIQPKLDGERMLFDGQKGWTRGSQFYIPEVIQHFLCKLPDGVILDGEVMLPLESGVFQDTAKATGKYRPELSPKLVYYVYDIVDLKKTFRERFAILQEMRKTLPKTIQVVATRGAENEEVVMNIFREFRNHGQEGAMVRNWDSPYKLEKRSNDLQKVKEWDDAEYKVIGTETGRGSAEGQAILVFDNPAGTVPKAKTFTAAPVGLEENARLLWKNRDSLVGQIWTVQFQGLSNTKVPRFPQALRQRVS